MKLPQLATDKANHYLYGAVITAVVAVPFGMGIGFLVGVGAAVLKEVVDGAINWKTTGNPYKGPHTVDHFDALATAAGSATVALPFLVKLLFS